MLLVLFKIDDNQYGLDTDWIAEIIPLVPLRELPGTPDYIRGVFDYRGQIVPVIDMSMLTVNKVCEERLSTRIILVEFIKKDDKTTLLGLMGESMTDTVEIDRTKLQETQVDSLDAPHLGKVFKKDETLIQTVDIEKLLPEQIKEKLFD